MNYGLLNRGGLRVLITLSSETRPVPSGVGVYESFVIDHCVTARPSHPAQLALSWLQEMESQWTAPW